MDHQHAKSGLLLMCSRRRARGNDCVGLGGGDTGTGSGSDAGEGAFREMISKSRLYRLFRVTALIWLCKAFHSSRQRTTCVARSNRTPGILIFLIGLQPLLSGSHPLKGSHWVLCRLWPIEYYNNVILIPTQTPSFTAVIRAAYLAIRHTAWFRRNYCRGGDW